jgi:hypothetical protein
MEMDALISVKWSQASYVLQLASAKKYVGKEHSIAINTHVMMGTI